jgi:copper chaperone
MEHPMPTQFVTIGRPQTPGAGGCSCCGPAPETATGTPTTVPSIMHPQESTAMTTTTYSVTGMTCGHCVSAVTEEIKKLPGVQDVAVDLVEGGASQVTVASAGPLPEQEVRDAVDEAGYELASSPS